MPLYFIASIPPDPLRSRVKALKEEMRDRFGAGHALKSPAHITLQMPFKRPESEELQLIELLTAFAERQNSFHATLQNFDCFEPRVIFIGVENHQPFDQLHAGLKSVLLDSGFLTTEETRSKFHPHMTLATRDLKLAVFPEAWEAFKDRPFSDGFDVKSLFLLKHNGKFWDIYREFVFAPSI